MNGPVTQQGIAQQFRFVPTRLTFDLEREHKDVFEAAAKVCPKLVAAVADVRFQIPLPRSANADMDRRFYRLPNHNRSFCYGLSDTDNFFSGAAVVFKGTEPLLEDFDAFVHWMTKAPFRKSTRVMADHFPLSEGKIPGAVSVAEATREAAIALELQAKHLKFYGELARLPTPLFIHSLSEPDNARATAVLERRLSQSAFERIAPVLSRGLAVYVYYYPSAPIRSNVWGGMSSKRLSEHLKRIFDLSVSVNGWVRLIVRLLYMGYLPYSIRNEGLGACMDPGNAALDGGFCDVDSITRIETSSDDEFFAESIITSIAMLRTTIEGSMASVMTPDYCPSIEPFVISRYLGYSIEQAINTEARSGLYLDPRICRLVSPRSLADVQAAIKRERRAHWYSMFLKGQS